MAATAKSTAFNVSSFLPGLLIVEPEVANVFVLPSGRLSVSLSVCPKLWYKAIIPTLLARLQSFPPEIAQQGW